jgi:hypothetical protein
MLNIFGRRNVYALALILMAGALTWLGMTNISAPPYPESYMLDTYHYMGLGFSLGIALLWWTRQVLIHQPR